MNAQQLQSVRAGFDDEARGSQAVFRAALEALSHPGRPVEVPLACELPRLGQPAAAGLLLALLDADCSLWLSPSLRAGDAGPWLRFHTGCRLVEDADEAQFAWVGCGDLMPPLASLRQGSDAYPDESATCVIEVDGIDAGGAWRLQGPGIPGERRLRVGGGLPRDFVAQWALNHAGFPRGVDLFLASASQVTGLARSTRIEE